MKALSHPLAPLAALAVATTIFLCAYAAAGAGLSRRAELILSITWQLMLLVWMLQDARKRRQIPCYDFGMLAAILVPLALLWYCLWSRGWRGLLLLLLLVLIWLAPYLMAAAFWVL